MSNQSYRVNDRIRIREVRLIDEEGNNLGVKPTREAREYAESKGLDLVEVAPDARPPVCRVMDYGKFMYEQTKKERLAKKAQKQVDIKGLRIRPDTDPYHVSFKVKQARGFLMKGNKVRVVCHFRGRERSHPEIARTLMKDIAEQLKDISVVEQHPNFEGRNMTMLIAPDATAIEKLKAAAKKAKKDAKPGAELEPEGEEVEEIEEELEDMDDDFEEDDDFDDEEDFEDDEDDEDEEDIEDEDDK